MFGKTLIRLSVVVAALTAMAFVSVARADTFGEGDNEFDIDFVPITGDASSANGTNISRQSGGGWGYRTFTDPGNYRIGVYEITNDQWDKFEAGLGVPVTGRPSDAYGEHTQSKGANAPVSRVSWYEAAQFVNWLNTSTGHHPAYKFTGTQGRLNYMPGTWSAAEAAGGTNLYRHKDAFYFLPTDDEWVKAAYWNGTTLQMYPTKDNSVPFEWTRIGGVNADDQAGGWNISNAYPSNSSADDRAWDVTAGYCPEELNGTYDMMVNLWEWMEDPWDYPNYGAGSERALRGSGFSSIAFNGSLTYRRYDEAFRELGNTTFRVASISEPGEDREEDEGRHERHERHEEDEEAKGAFFGGFACATAIGLLCAVWIAIGVWVYCDAVARDMEDPVLWLILLLLSGLIGLVIYLIVRSPKEE